VHEPRGKPDLSSLYGSLVFVLSLGRFVGRVLSCLRSVRWHSSSQVAGDRFRRRCSLVLDCNLRYLDIR